MGITQLISRLSKTVIVIIGAFALCVSSSLKADDLEMYDPNTHALLGTITSENMFTSFMTSAPGPWRPWVSCTKDARIEYSLQRLGQDPNKSGTAWKLRFRNMHSDSAVFVGWTFNPPEKGGHDHPEQTISLILPNQVDQAFLVTANSEVPNIIVRYVSVVDVQDEQPSNSESVLQSAADNKIDAIDLFYLWEALRLGAVKAPPAIFQKRAAIVYNRKLLDSLQAFDLYGYDVGVNSPPLRGGDILVGYNEDDGDDTSKNTVILVVNSFNSETGVVEGKQYYQQKITDRKLHLYGGPSDTKIRPIRPCFRWLRPISKTFYATLSSL